jgi:prefoldin subunit 5
MAIQQAIEEVNQIIDTLRRTLDDMEEVLETLELAERQKTADEQEIETLRRSLRHLHRPKEGGQHPQRH